MLFFRGGKFSTVKKMAHPTTTKLEDAKSLILKYASQVTKDVETIPIMQAHGRIVSEDIFSEINLPTQDNAAVDGFAVFSEQMAKSSFTAVIVVMARAGHPFEGEVKFGQAIRIYTGAVVPKGPDVVIMHEDCIDKGDQVIFKKKLKPGTNIRSCGENLAKGECVVQKGQKITPSDMGQIAAAGFSKVNVFRLLKVVIYSTGDEVMEMGTKIKGGQIHDSNRPILSGLLSSENVDIIDGGIIPDNEQKLIDAYNEGLKKADVIISSGGASDGIEDHTQKALSAIGAKNLFWRLAMKPGRPMSVAQKNEKIFFCLPGNPVAAFVCFKLLIAPVMDALSGRKPREPMTFRIKAGFQHKKQPGRTEYLRAVIQIDNAGHQHILLHGRKGAGVISSLTGAHGLVEIPFESKGVELGDILNFIPFQEQVL